MRRVRTLKCQTIVEYMHEYLDEEISSEHKIELREHIQECEECSIYFHQLKKTIALVQSTSHVQAPIDFTEKVMSKLPTEKKKIGIQRWLIQHPLLTAASLFILLMGSSMVTLWNEDHQFSVSKQPNLIVQNNTVIVPKGEVVIGDVTVRNGDISIEGKVDGNVTVINGEPYKAAAGTVTGDIEEINEVFEWMWYHIKKTAGEIVSVFDTPQGQE